MESNRPIILFVIILLLVGLLAMVLRLTRGGNSRTSGPGGSFGKDGTDASLSELPIAGKWEITERVVAASADCTEDIGTSSTETFEISEQQGQLQLKGYGGQIATLWTVAWDGKSNTASFAGQFNDEGGTTTGTWVLHPSGDALSGSKSWAWKVSTYSCVGGESTIEGSRR